NEKHVIASVVVVGCEPGEFLFCVPCTNHYSQRRSDLESTSARQFGLGQHREGKTRRGSASKRRVDNHHLESIWVDSLGDGLRRRTCLCTLEGLEYGLNCLRV